MSRLDADILLGYALAAQHGDDNALGQLVRVTQPAVHRFCARFTSAEDADDVTQEVYLRVARNLAQYRGDAPVLAWMLSIARYVCADHVRRNQRRSRLAARLRNERPAASAPGSHLDLTALIDALEPDRKLAFVLTQVVGLSYDEAALTCGCPIGTIRSRVARARAELVDAVQAADAQ